MGQVESKEIICISMDLHGSLIPYKSERTANIGPQNRSDLVKFIDVRSSNELSIYKLNVAPPGTCGINTGFNTNSFKEYLGRTPSFSFANLEENLLRILSETRGPNEKAQARIPTDITAMTDVNSDLFAWEPFNYDEKTVKNIFMDKNFSVDRRMSNYSYSITILNGEFKGQNILDLNFLSSRGITKEFLKNLYEGNLYEGVTIEIYDFGNAGLLLSRISFSQLVKLVNALNLSDKIFFLDNSCSVLLGQKLPDLNRHNQNLPLKSFFQSDNNLKDLLVTDEQVTVVNLDPTVEDYSTMRMLPSEVSAFNVGKNRSDFITKYGAKEGGKRKSRKLRSKKLRFKKLRSKKLRFKKLRFKKLRSKKLRSRKH
jgi:hypothetical protein